jgi:hypothetical protein
MISVVFPVHNGDIGLAIHHARWLAKIGPFRCEAIVAFDNTINIDALKGFTDLLGRSFPKMTKLRYTRPPTSQWPHAPNWAWQNTAKHMIGKGPWLWMEADAIALKKEWLDVIDREYHQSGMPFMGPHVDGMAHVNGVAVYPHNTPELLAHAMRSKDMAWDYEAGPEMLYRTHNASGTMQHLWSVDGDRWLECGGGQVPILLDAGSLQKNLKPSAVLLHRVKDRSVIDLLMSGAFKT